MFLHVIFALMLGIVVLILLVMIILKTFAAFGRFIWQSHWFALLLIFAIIIMVALSIIDTILVTGV